MLEKIVPLAEEATRGVQGAAALSASERFASQLAPKGIREILTLNGNLLKRGERLHLTDSKLGIDLTVDLMKDGRATVMPGVPGYLLHGGAGARMGFFPDTLSRFEQTRSMIPLEVGRRTPLGVEGDWLLKSGPSAIQLDPVAGGIAGDHYLRMKLFRADAALVPKIPEMQPVTTPGIKPAITSKLSWKF